MVTYLSGERIQGSSAAGDPTAGWTIEGSGMTPNGTTGVFDFADNTSTEYTAAYDTGSTQGNAWILRCKIYITSTESSDGAYMFTTYGPCLDCAKLIYQSGIKEFHYEYDYKNQEGVDFLKSHWKEYEGQKIYKHGNELDGWVDEQQLLPFSN